ncbi:hypothetical protein [Phormidium sp. CCY1219]|nr:hypothetical protein [Phormidium sp. CCY1219]MEB3827748.1 hypothetical protein [Phormidium sp. CCY1219]
MRGEWAIAPQADRKKAIAGKQNCLSAIAPMLDPQVRCPTDILGRA